MAQQRIFEVGGLARDSRVESEVAGERTSGRIDVTAREFYRHLQRRR
jgi:hypothetical protein